MELTDKIVLPILSYCVASIMMTVVNKFVVSGRQFTMTFLRESIELILFSVTDRQMARKSPCYPIVCLCRMCMVRQAYRRHQLYGTPSSTVLWLQLTLQQSVTGT